LTITKAITDLNKGTKLDIDMRFKK